MTEITYTAKGPPLLYSVLANKTLLKCDTPFSLLHYTVPSMFISKDKYYATWLKGRKGNFYFL